jgi:hypothetical protein
LLTVFGTTRRLAATSLFVAPGSAHANTIRARNANACAEVARRDHRINSLRSPSVNVSSAFGRPVFRTNTHYHYRMDFRRTTLALE